MFALPMIQRINSIKIVWLDRMNNTIIKHLFAYIIPMKIRFFSFTTQQTYASYTRI